ncbi:hypothetical protein P20495_0510 [Pseudoalteromonas sp. BSi20495]|nr:hypothetical protein P20495_0510 [Pseudoalteromonas sp. BSi20495]
MNKFNSNLICVFLKAHILILELQFGFTFVVTQLEFLY